MGDRELLAIVFDDRTTIGMVRLYAQQTARKLAEFLERRSAVPASEAEPAINETFGESAKEKIADLFGE